MANTEGLPDEFVESLMTTPSTGSSQQSKASKQRQRILERMDMPMPQGGPSAKVVRFSQRPQESSRVEEVDESTPVDALPQPIVGEILERTPSAIPQRRQQGAGKKPSRFALQQQNQSSTLNGFPSVNMPLGTFVKAKPMKPKPGVRPKVVAATPPPVVKSKPLHKEGITTESMLEASRRDASQMLEGMTLDEIRQEQNELSSALSPATIAFLKKRKKQNKPSLAQEDTVPPSPKEDLDVPSLDNAPQKVSQVDKKKQIASLVSKVRTHEEMDQVYETVMNDAHPLSRDDTEEPQGNDFFMACDLLRSSNARQALWASRVVLASLTERLKESNSGQRDANVNKDWPVVLPVSLRCLLDEPLSRSGGFLLHSNVLQALHILLLLTAHPDHVHRAFPTSEPTAADIYQEFFMDDAVPTPRLEDIYKSASPQPIPLESTSKQDGSAAAYSTQSSSTSAQSDGESFEKDPMWTLLSKMKIVPRLAQLLSSGKNNHDTIAWPPEAWMAMTGILTMIAQRSPGAASAISHHETIIKVLVDRISATIQESADESPELVSEWKIVHSTLELMGTLARQTRVAAETLPISEVLPPLLATVATNDREHQLQRLGIQLWRTLLRYGLGLEAIETMSVAAATHLAVSPLSKYSLSADFCTAFAQVFECAFIVEESKSSTKIPHAAASILSNIQLYLGASIRQTFLLPSSSSSAAEVDVQGGISQYRWNTARMRLLSNYWRLASVSKDASDDSGETKSADEAWSMEQVLVCLEALDEWTDSGSLVEQACKHSGGFLKERRSLEPKEWAIEAAACGFIESFASLLLTLSTSLKTQNNRMVQELCQSVFKHLLPYMLKDQLHLNDDDVQPPTALSSGVTPLARRGWAIQCDIVVAKLLFRCIATGVASSSSDRHLVRTLVFALLGRLEIGHEASAAILLSQDSLFKATGDPLSEPDTDRSATSPISSMFLAELCGSEKSRQQLDHSFKLQHGFGITQEGCGAFELQSLLSGADLPGPSSASTDLSLPLGPFWLWQTLTGQIRTKVEQVTHATDEALQVVSAVLGLLLDVEEGMDILESDTLKYVPQVPLGVKLYYLMNVCLHNETILRDERISELGQSLLDRFWPCITVQSVSEFARECLQHTDPSKTQTTDLDEKEKQFLKLLEPETSQECGLTSQEARSVEAFLEDIVEAYNDYGAQYDFFTKCIRLFLLPMFPVSLRVRTLRDLRGALHLLTLPSEVEPADETMQKLLAHSASDHTATRDEPEILEAVTQVLMPGNLPRPAQGYVRAYAVAVLTRNLLLCRTTGEGVETMIRRLVRLDKATVESIFGSVSDIQKEYTREELASATLQAISPSETTSTMEFFTEEDLQNRLAQWKS